MKLKKPRFWDQKKPNLYAFLFYPLAIFIQILNSIKNKVPKNNFKIKTICLGNIYIGGTGKTSLCLTLKNILDKKNIRSCFIKKFYKDQYDEQKLLKQNGKLFLEKKRVDAIQKAEEENYEIAILDDGLQDKSINSDINIVCFNNINWIGNGMTIPSGPLRETINNLKNYNHIFLNGNLENIDNIQKKILSINPRSNVYIGKYEVTNINEFNKQDNYFVFSGIGNHASFILMLKNEGLKIINHLEFPDHYQYTVSDINKIIKIAKNLNCKIITTEKDYLRLENLNISEIKVVKSSIKIINEENFLKAIL